MLALYLHIILLLDCIFNIIIKQYMKNTSLQKGFTLVELVMVIVILGILAAIAVPKMGHLTRKAHVATINGIVGSINTGINGYRLSSVLNGTGGVFPSQLDSIPVARYASTSERLFTSVLADGISDNKWYKETNEVYKVFLSDTTFILRYFPVSQWGEPKGTFKLYAF